MPRSGRRALVAAGGILLLVLVAGRTGTPHTRSVDHVPAASSPWDPPAAAAVLGSAATPDPGCDPATAMLARLFPTLATLALTSSDTGPEAYGAAVDRQRELTRAAAAALGVELDASWIDDALPGDLHGGCPAT